MSAAPSSALALALLLTACEGAAPRHEASASAPAASAAAALGSVVAGAARGARSLPSAAPSAAQHAKAPAAAPARCPEDMRLIEGGRLVTGTDDKAGNSDEYPRFETRIASYCLDRTEVSVARYRSCVERGRCTPASAQGRFCNARFSDRDAHPINCVDHAQAVAYCASLGRRLPGELEWEYAARGGSEQRAYSWGSEPPDGRTCWKHPGGTCEIGAYPPGAFDLLDMTGNVWEWTADWFGPYPFPPEHGTARVNKGGSWSRRFEKWMRPGLRSRTPPKGQGSHLGLRCALSLPGEPCPYGALADGTCARGVDQLHCAAMTAWNGVRCARPGAPRCPEGRVERLGHGCVLAVDVAGPLVEAEAPPVVRARTPSFDADCAAHYPGRPSAYRYAGGTHAKRNAVSASAGCSNRDVGVGWNSTCCP